MSLRCMLGGPMMGHNLGGRPGRVGNPPADEASEGW